MIESERKPVSALGSVSFGWLHANGGFAFDQAFFLDPHRRIEQERAMHTFVAQRFPDEPIYNFEAHLVQVKGRQTPVALVGGLQPNLILGAAVGARLLFADDRDPDITPAPLADLDDIDRLRAIDWRETWIVSLFLEQIDIMRAELGDDVIVAPPFFWDTTGRATLHGIVTTAQKLFGERIFMEMNDNPALAHGIFAWIVEASVELIRLFADAAGMTVTGLHTGDCSVGMIGPDSFEEFVLPHLNSLSNRVGPLRLHSCGRSDHLLDRFRKLDHLASLNVGSDTSVARIRELFGPIPIDLIPDTKRLTSGTPRDVDEWVRRCVEENDGGPLQFQWHLDVGQPEANCLQINRTLAGLGFHTPRVGVC